MTLLTRRMMGSIASAAVLLAFALWYTLPTATGSTVPIPNEASKYVGSGPYDGQVFAGRLGPVGGKPDTKDVWEFANGMFVSKECERRCSYPPRPYYVRADKGKTEFVSETRCPYKDAKLVWRGTVDKESIQGVMTFTVSRWYWTVEKKFAFEGRLRNRALPVATR